MDLPDMAYDAPEFQEESYDDYKKEDIVWVRYRNKEYLGKVNAYYPNQCKSKRKISYFFFPLNRQSVKRNAIFTADISKVWPFSLNDELPEDANEELQYSYYQAKRLLTTGVSEEELIEEFEQSKAEQEAAKQKTGPSKRKSTGDLQQKVTGGTSTAKSTPKTPKSTGKTAKEMPQKQPKPMEPVFQPGEQIIVDTQNGKWPGIFESYVEGHPDTIRYSLFPRKTSQEILIGQKDSIIPLQMEKILEIGYKENANGSEMLMVALRDAYAYALLRIAQNVGSSEQQPLLATVAPTPKETENQQESVTSNENIRMTPSVTAEKQKTQPEVKEEETEENNPLLALLQLQLANGHMAESSPQQQPKEEPTANDTESPPSPRQEPEPESGKTARPPPMSPPTSSRRMALDPYNALRIFPGLGVPLPPPPSPPAPEAEPSSSLQLGSAILPPPPKLPNQHVEMENNRAGMGMQFPPYPPHFRHPPSPFGAGGMLPPNRHSHLNMSHPSSIRPGMHPQPLHHRPMGLNQQRPPQFQNQPGTDCEETLLALASRTSRGHPHQPIPLAHTQFGDIGDMNSGGFADDDIIELLELELVDEWNRTKRGRRKKLRKNERKKRRKESIHP